MISLIFRILKDRRRVLLAYILVVLATLEMYIALFPAIQNQAQNLNKMLEAYPKALMEAFGFVSTKALFSRLESYMSTEYFSFFWPIMVITLMVSFANHMIVAEVERGTVEFVLSQPISRVKLFFGRYLAGVIYFIFFNTVSIFAMIPLAKIHNINYEIGHFYTVFGVGLLFGLSVFSLASLFSAIFNERGKAMAFSAAILLVMYVLNIVSTLKENLESLKYFSIFYYFSPTKVFGQNEIVEFSVLVFLVLILVCAFSSAYYFWTKDIATS